MNEDLFDLDDDEWRDDDPSFDAFDTYSLQDKIFDFLDIISSDSNYDEMIEAVSNEFEMSPDKVEDYVNEDNHRVYSFVSWDSEIANVTADATYKATYEA